MDIPQPSSKRELRKLNKALEQQWGVRYEEPVTPYGEKGLHEDLAESILFYKLNPKALQDVAPQRYRFVQSTI